MNGMMKALVGGFLWLLGMGAAFAWSGTAYFKNDASFQIKAYARETGAVFGGGSAAKGATLTLNPGGSTQQTIVGTSGGTVIGFGYTFSSGYKVCVKYSATSFAAAKSKTACDTVEEYGAIQGVSGSGPSPASGYPSVIYVVFENYVPPQCSGTVRWGTSNFCAATAPTTANGSSVLLNNVTVGATGSATAVCTNGAWSTVMATCTAAMAAPASLTATQGTIQGKVQLTWATVSGASNYEVQYRKQGASVWASAVGVASGWQMSTTDESVFEFQVRATNAVGAGTFSAVATGYIRPQIMPVFVSQNVPTDVKAGAAFTATQVWKNVGYTTWSDATFQLVGAVGSGNFGATPGTFQSAVSLDQTGTSTLSLTAPTTAGTYSFQRQFQKSGVSYGTPSTLVNIKVWGDPVCSALTTTKAYVYDLNGTIGVQFNVNNQTTGVTASVWNESAGPSSSKPYTPVYGAGMYKFDVPLANHGGATGVYRVKVDVSNVVATGSCETTFELRPLDMPVVSLQELIGKSGTNGFVVGQQAGDPFLKASVTRTESLPVTLELVNGQGGVASTASLAANAESVNVAGDRWSGAAWSVEAYTLRVRYSDPSAASQGKTLELPIELILAPNGNILRLSIAPVHPLKATTAISRAGQQPYDSALQGAWVSKIALQGGGDLDEFAPMGEAGTRDHLLAYESLYGKSLAGTARAVPPEGVILVVPLEITTQAKIPTLPVRNLAATDGTLEDIVRVTWETPAEGGTGFVYDLYRGDELLVQNMTARMYEDTPPMRGQEYAYRVVATLTTDRSTAVEDPGHVPACRAARLIGASLNADMSAINGLIERWDCLDGLTGTSGIDADPTQELALGGTKVYRSFSVPVPLELRDGAHVLKLGMESQGVTLNSSRVYDVPFNLSRASITVNNLTILYDGSPARDGQDAASIGRFGIRMEGGSGIGFAEEVK